MKFIVRKAVRDDMDDVISMIQELAEFEKMAGENKLTVHDLIRDGGYDSDTAHPLFVCFVAEEENPAEKSRNLLGYALCFNSYSTWTGKALLMKDLFIRSEYRRFGVGRQIFKAVAQHAYNHQYKRVDFHVLNWNERAIQFYKSMGAEDLTQKEEWAFYRLALK